MLLEKMNETVWHVKQQDGHGIFEFRAREQGGKIKLIGISLIDEDKEQKSISFEMDQSEFYRFYDIVSKFKSIIESPQSLSTAEFNSLNPQTNLNSPAPLSLDGEDVSKAKQSFSGGQNILKKKAVGDYDIGLASLEALDQSDQSDQTDEEAMETALNELGFDENQIHSGHIKPVSDGEGSTPNSSSQYTKPQAISPEQALYKQKPPIPESGNSEQIVPNNSLTTEPKPQRKGEIEIQKPTVPKKKDSGESNEGKDALDPKEWDPW